MGATWFTNYAVRFDGGPEITVTEVDNSESLAIEKAQEIMRRTRYILNEDILATARVVYVESAD
jgi:hypothetical protein